MSESTDEIQNYHKMQELHLKKDEADNEVLKHYQNFLKRKMFPPEVMPCGQCTRWKQTMQQCPCKTVTYCSKQCQKKNWKSHKEFCPAATPSKDVQSSPATSPTGKSGKSSNRKKK